ncbi:hypothetical protein [Bacillus sp. FJAT-49736]|uniref:hypothetical protein n=1 Tax=Bacillus sp. FJAT-49736 TaxID=2833582 RepID=UPI001BC9D5FD|nr:hypothetical protein [Bacillus sp. FJAT-49736]MBS4174294.1 hypothetical protein [Bacillus sp. FJAT-49736]
MGLLDWATDKVQSFTGESERRALVEETKTIYSQHRATVESKLMIINRLIKEFNQKIHFLNIFRKEKVKITIDALHAFLSKFGSLEKANRFANEEEKEILDLPDKRFEEMEDYIQDIDWSKDEVFKKTFFKTVFGARSETRKQNLSMREELHEYRLEAKSTEKKMDLKEKSVLWDMEISDLYKRNIQTIDQTVKEKILPEMELIEAMMDAEVIKNYILAKQELENIPMNKDISLLKGTLYEKHYNFIKNTFLFFIVSKKVYNTPVLTRLLNEKLSKEDKVELEKQARILEDQETVLKQNMVQGA